MATSLGSVQNGTAISSSTSSSISAPQGQLLVGVLQKRRRTLDSTIYSHVWCSGTQCTSKQRVLYDWSKPLLSSIPAPGCSSANVPHQQGGMAVAGNVHNLDRHERGAATPPQGLTFAESRSRSDCPGSYVQPACLGLARHNDHFTDWQC